MLHKRKKYYRIFLLGKAYLWSDLLLLLKKMKIERKHLSTEYLHVVRVVVAT
jgi:hypothetical protein